MIARRGDVAILWVRHSGLPGRSSILLLSAVPCLCLVLGCQPPSHESPSGDSSYRGKRSGRPSVRWLTSVKRTSVCVNVRNFQRVVQFAACGIAKVYR